ncbi:MAG: NUDIX hydrolase [Sphingobacteriales bacterium]|nr:NUDIX hydrolase [Sphingobacteriales bacterium]
MFIKIYFGDKPLFLCDTVDEQLSPYIHHEDTVFIDELDSHTVKSMLHEMEQEKIHAGVFVHPSLDELKKAVFKKFTLVKAAGGLVVNGKNEWLLIFRRGKWDLPKGKLDPGEKLEACAVREVEEETGLQKIKLLSPLCITYHTYHEGTKFILKESHWFQMSVGGEPSLVPQTEEDIQEAKWVKPAGLQEYLEDTYPSVAEVLSLMREK